MPEYLSPGVYVEEIDAGPVPIEGVSTSIAGAVGVTVQGPTTGKPEPVTSFAEFQRIFGGFLPAPDPALQSRWLLDAREGGEWWKFPLSVKGFFDEGGRQLYVKRVFAGGGGVAGKGATPAKGQIGQGMVAAITQDVTGTSNTIRLQHLVDIAVGTQLNLFAGGKGLPDNPFTVRSYDPVLSSVVLDKPLGASLKAGRDLVEIHARSAVQVPSAAVTLDFTAKALGDWGNSISVRVRPMVGATLTILPDPAVAGQPFITSLSKNEPKGQTTIGVNDTSGFSTTASDHVRIAGQEYVLSNVNAGAQTVDIATPLSGDLPAGTIVARMRPASAANATSLHVSNASQIYDGAILQLDNGTNKETQSVSASNVSGDQVTFSTPLANAYFEGHKVRIIEAEVATRSLIDNVVQALEVFQNLRLHDDQTPDFIVTGVNLASALVDVRTVPPAQGGGYSETDLSLFPTSPEGEWLPLTKGFDHLEDLTVDDFVGVDLGSEARTGIQALEDITQISICAVPGMWSRTIQSALITHCETLRYRFAILDPPDGLTIEQIMTFREPLDTKYAALYYPWLVVRDPSLRQDVDVAPSGHMAGIYARVDIQRGVHKAPANEVILSITGISQDVSKREQDLLNPIAINALRFFPQRGNRVWGARTVSSNASWKYINVRRLFIFVEASIDYGTQWVVFEPNDEPLWARVRQTISNFLSTVWRNGALQGTKPADAFFVKCDRTTMTQDDIDNGRLICVIGIAPVKPAEFVIFRIQQKTLETPTT
jgi:phage tail sheath protein FI